MNPTKQQAFEKISELVERFREHQEEYKRGTYNEHQTRIDYINPFFKALGWDMDNEQGLAEAYREVIHEDKVKVGGATKAPDYAFTLYGQRKFFVDAKKPGININADIGPAYQVRRYGWSAKVPLSVVTDFEEFAIYDCTKKPNPGDKSSVSRIKYLTFEQYLEEFDFLWDIFAKENLPKGRFDKYVQSDTGKKGTATVDEEFLKSIEQWRTYLATSIALRNKSLSVDELNYAVQKTIDRIIFLRMCEDRGVEAYGLLRKAAEKGEVYTNLFGLFHTADEKYNSGLFDFKEDRITRELVIDNKVLKTIIGELYYPKCEYEFSVMPADILGSVYERFLGKTIRLTAGHQAKVEEKPEVRKAGGVYYTPKYIVDYIVENTVGKLLEGKTPKDVEKLRICDPACGSGSFLIGAFQYLLDWHLKYYTNLPLSKLERGPGGEVRQERGPGGEVRKRGPRGEAVTPDGNLTTAVKKRILLNNIYGVDIDPQAVEVTKLNLLLKALEGETQASISQQMTLFHERVLPNLSHNIQCGNSLIGPDFYDNQFDLFPDQMKKINAFDWHRAFPEVFGEKASSDEALAKSGFDCVIGNPPYLKLTINNTEHKILSYYDNIYKSYSGGSSKNLFQLFLEKANILSSNFFSYIIPEALLTTASNGKIRDILSNQNNINSIVIFDHFVFQDATIGTTILVCEKNAKRDTDVIQIDRNKNQILKQKLILNNGLEPWDISIDQSTQEFFQRILKGTVTLGSISEMSKGMVVKNRQNVLHENNNENSLPFLLGNCMSRYTYHYDRYAIYHDLEIIGGTRVLQKHTEIPRLLIRRTGEKICAAYSDKPELIESTIYILRSDKIDLMYLLGLLNSKLLSYYLSKRLITNKQGYPQILMNQLEQLPIILSEGKMKELIIEYVKRIMTLFNSLYEHNLEETRQQLQRAIDHAERRIDELVYELYGLTEEEIAVVEGGSSRH